MSSISLSDTGETNYKVLTFAESEQSEDIHVKTVLLPHSDNNLEKGVIYFLHYYVVKMYLFLKGLFLKR
jgi:hypothetical protein